MCRALRTLGPPIAGLSALLGARGALAQEAASGLDSGDTAWILVSSAIVLMMTVPGLALFYGGLVRVKNVLSIRKRRLKRGKLDLHTMLRRNMAHGGVPFERVFKERRKDRPKLVILCDVSSSVANVSRFMLQFVYSLQECFTKIRAYVFVSELGEVTQLFKDEEINSAIEKALDGGEVINVYTRSNFGHAFHHFWQNFLASVDNKTTVLILGDARNNYNDPRAWCLREIHTKAKNVVWLNPENPSAWGFGDSVMDKYLPYTDVAEEVRNLRQLSKVVDSLLL